MKMGWNQLIQMLQVVLKFWLNILQKPSCEYYSVNTARSAFLSILPAVSGFTFSEQLFN